MPGTTPLGITYPCGGDTIDPAAFQTYAETTQGAISVIQAQVDEALRPDMVWVRTISAGQNVVAGATTTIGYGLVMYDTAGMFNLATPTIVTIQSAGTYLANCFYTRNGLATTETSSRIAILVNGAEFGAMKIDGGTAAPFSAAEPYLASALLIGLSPGDQVTSTHLFTGSGNHNIRHALAVTKVSIP